MNVQDEPIESARSAALLKCDLHDWTQEAQRLGPQAAACLQAVHSAVEEALDVRSLENQPQWRGEGDGGHAHFTGPTAAQRAVESAIRAVEAVRQLEFRVHLRAAVGLDTVEVDADLDRSTRPDWNLAGHMVAGDVCPPSAVCITEDTHDALRVAAPALAEEFAYLGSTSKDLAPVFVRPPHLKPARPKGLRNRDADTYPACAALRRAYTSPPFRLLRSWAPPHLKFAVPLDLERVFHLPLLRRLDDRPGLSSARVSTDAGDADARPPISYPPQSLPSVLAGVASFVVLGDPGSGKSCLLRYVALVAAGGQALTYQRLGVQERLLPIYATVATLLRCHDQHPDDPPERLFARILAGTTGVSEESLTGAIREACGRDRALFLLDGLDEVPASRGARAAASLIERLAHEPGLRRNRWIVSCRPLDFPGLALPSGTVPYVIEPLPREAVRPMLASYLTEIERGWGTGPADAERAGRRRADELAHAWELRAGWEPFAGIPLLLALAAQLDAQQGNVVPSRIRLFDLATKTLVDSWAEARRDAEGRQPGRAVDYDQEGRVVLPGLALHAHENWADARIPEEQLLPEITRRLSGRPTAATLTAGVATAPGRDFLQRLEAAGALLRETGPGEWSFFYRSFQDFLAARHLVQEGSFAARLAPVKYAPRWREIVRMTVGELAVIHLRVREAADLVRSILADLGHWHNAELHKGVVVAALCASEVPGLDTGLDREIVVRLESAIRGTPEVPGLPESVLHATLRQIRGTPVADRLADRLASNPTDPNRFSSRPRAALAELGAPQAIDLLLKDLRSGPGGAHLVRVAQDLGRLRRPEVLPELRRVLADDGLDEGVRWAAALALGSLGDRESIPYLRRILAEPTAKESSHLRGGAVLALGRLQCREIVPRLLDGLSGRDASFPRTQAVYALATMHVRAAEGELVRILHSESLGELTLAAVRALGEIGGAGARSTLLDLLRDSKTHTILCAAAALALSALGVEEVLPILSAAIRPPTLPADAAEGLPPEGAIRAMGILRDRQAVDDLMRILEHPSERVADFEGLREAALALGHLRETASIPRLREVLRTHRDPRVREAAGAALWEVTESTGDQ